MYTCTTEIRISFSWVFVSCEKDQLINITSLVPDLGHSTAQVQLLLWTCPDSVQSVQQFLAHLPRSPGVHQRNQGVVKLNYIYSSNNTISMLCSVIYRGRFGWGEVVRGQGSYCSLLLCFSKKYWPVVFRVVVGEGEGGSLCSVTIPLALAKYVNFLDLPW